MNTNGRDLALIRAMEQSTETATFPLPIADVNKTLHTLIGLFPLETLIRLSKGLSEAVKVIERCGDDESFSLSQPTAERERTTRTKTRLSESERADILARRDRGETLAEIAKAIGRSYGAVYKVVTYEQITQ